MQTRKHGPRQIETHRASDPRLCGALFVILFLCFFVSCFFCLFVCLFVGCLVHRQVRPLIAEGVKHVVRTHTRLAQVLFVWFVCLAQVLIGWFVFWLVGSSVVWFVWLVGSRSSRI